MCAADRCDCVHDGVVWCDMPEGMYLLSHIVLLQVNHAVPSERIETAQGNRFVKHAALFQVIETAQRNGFVNHSVLPSKWLKEGMDVLTIQFCFKWLKGPNDIHL